MDIGLCCSPCDTCGSGVGGLWEPGAGELGTLFQKSKGWEGFTE